ncbi:MAG TPA: hypothetical protein VE522_06700, partial [Actinomycetota bacterium]|nr:hypothetical protein [Actinomycetota bacterium]
DRPRGSGQAPARLARRVGSPGPPGSEELVGRAAPRGHKGTVIVVFLLERLRRRDASAARAV